MRRDTKLVFQIKLKKGVWIGTGRSSLELGGDRESRFVADLMVNKVWSREKRRQPLRC